MVYSVRQFLYASNATTYLGQLGLRDLTLVLMVPINAWLQMGANDARWT